MDSLAFAKIHQDEWDRLDELSKRRLTGAESDEFVRLYQTASAHLALVRTKGSDPNVVLHLSAILGRARSQLTGSGGGTVAGLRRVFTRTLPLAFYRIRWWALAVTTFFVLTFLVVLTHYMMHPEMLDALGPEPQRAAYAKEAFAAYYTEYDNSTFTAMVWLNNAWISLQAVAGGITGIFPLVVLWNNAVQIGGAAAVMEEYDGLGIFFQLILPHGLLELTAIFFACAAGIRVFWALLVPGSQPRRFAVASEGRQTFLVALGLIVVLLVSGLVEGFVTPSTLHWAVKIAIGVIVLIGFWVWVIMYGRAALRAGDSADDLDAGWRVAYN